MSELCESNIKKELNICIKKEDLYDNNFDVQALHHSVLFTNGRFIYE